MNINDLVRYRTMGYSSSVSCGGELDTNAKIMIATRFDQIFKASWNSNKVYPLDRFEIRVTGGTLYINYAYKNYRYGFKCYLQKYPAQCGMALVKSLTFTEQASQGFIKFCMYFTRELVYRNGFAAATFIIARDERIKDVLEGNKKFDLLEALTTKSTLTYLCNIYKGNESAMFRHTSIYEGYL